MRDSMQCDGTQRRHAAEQCEPEWEDYVPDLLVGATDVRTREWSIRDGLTARRPRDARGWDRVATRGGRPSSGPTKSKPLAGGHPSSSDTSEKDTNESPGSDYDADSGTGKESSSGTKESKTAVPMAEHEKETLTTQDEQNTGTSNYTHSSNSPRSRGVEVSDHSGSGLGKEGLRSRNGDKFSSDGERDLPPFGGEELPIIVDVSHVSSSMWEKSDDDEGAEFVALVKNINHKTTVATFREFLTEHGFPLATGRVTMIHVPHSRKRSNARGFAVVRCATAAVYNELYDHLHGRKFGSHRVLKVEPADHTVSTRMWTYAGPPEY